MTLAWVAVTVNAGPQVNPAHELTRRKAMHRHAVRGFVVIPALAALMLLAVGCGSSGNSSTPKTSPSATGSMSAAAAACHKIQATLAQAPATLGSLAQHPSSAKAQVTTFVTKLKTEAAASGNPALTSAVNRFSSSVQKALGSLKSHPGDVASLTSQLTTDSQEIVTACNRAAG
jgi:hypothetical protein